METLLTIAVASAELGISYKTLYRWVATKGAIPFEKIGDYLITIKRSDFDRFAADYKEGKYDRWKR
jgi:excisionase family DNA binding protein